MDQKRFYNQIRVTLSQSRKREREKRFSFHSDVQGEKIIKASKNACIGISIVSVACPSRPKRKEMAATQLAVALICVYAANYELFRYDPSELVPVFFTSSGSPQCFRDPSGHE